jgi:hypothetical protein
MNGIGSIKLLGSNPNREAKDAILPQRTQRAQRTQGLKNISFALLGMFDFILMV